MKKDTNKINQFETKSEDGTTYTVIEYKPTSNISSSSLKSYQSYLLTSNGNPVTAHNDGTFTMISGRRTKVRLFRV